MEKIIIAAVADNMAIGKDNDLLWHISDDLKFFKGQTSGNTVIMGRRTFESIGRPLPKRLNIVLSRGGKALEEKYPGLKVASDLEEAFAAAQEAASQKCFVIGGGTIYKAAFDIADRLVITHVHITREDADTFFPVIDPSVWKVESRSEMFTDQETGYNFEFVQYIRK
ncbi:MAG: dihydrofolate reductase [Bacteroidales bacterium]|nr:dihydrofolate reductase [Bacteroidales bacterium]